MKNKILTFIIEVLVGAIIATSGFLIYQKINNNREIPNGFRQEMTNRGDGETPPERPDGGTRPEMQNTTSNQGNA